MCCRYTISHRYCANAGQGRFCPLFRYYNTKRLSCQYSGFAFRRTAVGAGVSDAGAISEERKRVRRTCAIRWVSAACPAWADVCDFGTVRTAWRLMLRRQVTCGGGIRIVRDAHGGLAHADCTRVCVGECAACGNTVCGGYVHRCARILCGVSRASECVCVSRVLCSAKSRRRLRRGGFFADLQ